MTRDMRAAGGPARVASVATMGTAAAGATMGGAGADRAGALATARTGGALRTGEAVLAGSPVRADGVTASAASLEYREARGVAERGWGVNGR